MREFILRVLKGRTTPDFSVDDLVGAGRLDLVCRCVMNALCVANAVRYDTVIHVCMDGPADPPRVVSFFGAGIRGLQGDERSTALLLKQALTRGKGLQLNEQREVAPGIIVAKKAFERLVQEKAKVMPVYFLHKKGADIRTVKFGTDVVVILGDYIGMPRKSEKLLKNLDVQRLSLGPVMLFASQCITLVQHELDRGVA